MEPSTIGFVIYLGATLLLVIILSIYAYMISEWKSKTGFLKTIISMRSIYGAVLVHIYDTSTDFAVLISWGIMAAQELSGEKDHENVNMLSLLIPSILVIFVYRIIYFISWQSLGFKFSKLDVLLVLCDLYIFKLVYYHFKERYLSPCMTQRNLHLWEATFESMPQLVLGSIFLIRTYGTDLAESDNIWIVFLSLIGSLFSIVNRFGVEDEGYLISRARALHPTYKSCPCVSISYLFVKLWRFSETIARFSICTLLWTVINGLYLPIYLVLSSAIYFYFIHKWESRNLHSTETLFKLLIVIACKDAIQALPGIPLKPYLPLHIARFIDNIIMVALVSVFITIKFDCVLCYDKEARNYESNPYIFGLWIMAASGSILSFLIYLGLRCFKIMTEHQNRWEVDFVGKDEKIKNNKLNFIRAAAIDPSMMQAAKARLDKPDAPAREPKDYEMTDKTEPHRPDLDSMGTLTFSELDINLSTTL